MSKYIALDVGERRIGVAASDDLGIIASPKGHFLREKALPEIRTMIEMEQPDVLVIGMPYLPSGGLGSQAADVKNFINELREAFPGTTLDFENEVLTSKEAERRLSEIGDKNREKGDTDAMAACVILESYMERKRLE